MGEWFYFSRGYIVVGVKVKIGVEISVGSIAEFPAYRQVVFQRRDLGAKRLWVILSIKLGIKGWVGGTAVVSAEDDVML